MVVPKRLDRNDSTQLKLRYLEKIITNGYHGYQNSVLDPDDYAYYSNEIKYYVVNKYSIRQLRCVCHIYLIGYYEFDGNVSGLTVGYENTIRNNVFLPVFGDNYHNALCHEIWHCVLNANYDRFNDDYGNEWAKIDDYVSNYARTGIKEDVAETGMEFSNGRITKNEKFKIFRKFYEFSY
jgi:hypothetical protein